MSEYFLLSRVLLRFEKRSDDVVGDLSAATFTPDGSLWIGSDEMIGVERLSPVETNIFAKHKRFLIGDFIELFNNKDEIDIEGMDYADGYLWFTGSQSTKRKKAKGKKAKKDMQRLTEIKTDLNRYLLVRIPVINGKLVKSCALADDAEKKLTAACLEKRESSNILIEALKEDPHLGTIIATELPSKDNGLDIEGLAVRGNKVFLGLRGPVLRGWAIILEIEVEESEPGILTLKEVGESGRKYKKHFLELNGLGIRELCLHGKDMIVLAGPTMDLEGQMTVFKMKNVFKRSGDTISWQESEDLEVLFDLPFTVGSDHAEGLALYPCLGKKDCLFVVYDSPNDNRKPTEKEIYADVFQLN
ncbi:MAG: DUF3616 domain-containing protein [Oscillatoria sp. PMC 1068.18]|nr:DUF3616 domain-containing protein [Oscillatoria sp. PMC 1076.18]MEC4989965.1 DUF3616 domain-containing protein [Oscillatoria sp. PMC 1068.18]